MRTFASIQALVSQDSDQRVQLLDQLLSFDDDDALTSAVYESSSLSLAAAATDVVVNFGAVTAASFMLIVAYSNITVKMNGIGSPAIQVNKTPAKVNGQVLSNLQKFDRPGLVLWRGKVTSLHLANPDIVNPASVFIALVGNAA
jgi:hypothetical protein